jgi:glycosyltransferase involved in cell wall biosynthesis
MTARCVLHYGNIAGLSYFNALALRKHGLASRNVIPTTEDSFGTDQARSDRALPFDEALSVGTERRLAQLIKRGVFFTKALQVASLIHFYGTTILPKHLDAGIFRKLGKPMVISWAGGEARPYDWASRLNPYSYCSADRVHDRQVYHRLEKLGRTVRYAATDPELAVYSRPFFEKVFILRQPIDLEECVPSIPRPDTKCPVLLHIPTHRETKGTRFVEAAVGNLRAEGLRLEFRLLAPTLTQQQARAAIATADVYIDELRCGSYGMTAVEAMACGKPTVTYIREDLVDSYPPELPLVNANPDTITDRLRELVCDSELRHDLGQRGRQYAERYHSLEVIGPALLEIYRTIGYDG